MLQSRGIVRHYVSLSWDEEAHVAVSVLALVSAGEVAEVGSRTVTGDGAFVDPAESRRVVGSVHMRAVHVVSTGDLEGYLPLEGSVF